MCHSCIRPFSSLEGKWLRFAARIEVCSSLRSYPRQPADDTSIGNKKLYQESYFSITPTYHHWAINCQSLHLQSSQQEARSSLTSCFIHGYNRGPRVVKQFLQVFKLPRCDCCTLPGWNYSNISYNGHFLSPTHVTMSWLNTGNTGMSPHHSLLVLATMFNLAGMKFISPAILLSMRLLRITSFRAAFDCMKRTMVTKISMNSSTVTGC